MNEQSLRSFASVVERAEWSGTGFLVGEVVYAKLVGFTAQAPLAVGIPHCCGC